MRIVSPLKRITTTGMTPVGCTISTLNHKSPLGIVDGLKIVETAVAGNHGFTAPSRTWTSGVTYTVELWAKAAERSWVVLFNVMGATVPGGYFNLSTGAIGANTNLTGNLTTSYRDGWWRIQIQFTGNGETSGFNISACTGDGADEYTGTAGNGIYIWKYIERVGTLATDNVDDGGSGERVGIDLYMDFESGTPPFGFTYEGVTGRASRSTNFARAGSSSVRFELHDTDTSSNSVRSEINIGGPEPDTNGGTQFTQRKHWWIGLSTYLDSTFDVNDPTVPESIWQFHNSPNFSVGQSWGSYKFQNPYRLQVVNSQYQFVLQYDPTKSRSSTGAASTTIEIGPITTGVWVDWVIHIYPDYENGILEVWKDGVQVVNGNPAGGDSGNTYYNDDFGPYMKFGIYKWGWEAADDSGSPVEVRIMYIDEFRVGDETSDYDSVAP